MTVKPAIGIDIGGTTFLVAAVDTDGRMVASQEHEDACGR